MCKPISSKLYKNIITNKLCANKWLFKCDCYITILETVFMVIELSALVGWAVTGQFSVPDLYKRVREEATIFFFMKVWLRDKLADRIFPILLKPFNDEQKMCSDSFKDVINKISIQIIYLIYMYKQDLALGDLQWLICYKTQLNQIRKMMIFQAWLLSTNLLVFNVCGFLLNISSPFKKSKTVVFKPRKSLFVF